MRVRSASPFWPLRDGLLSNYPALSEDISCDVAVVGGGLCGAMVAYHLAEAGVDVIVVDKRDIGLGSTSSSTALVLYEVDMHLSDLIALRGERSAVRSYRLCLGAVGKLRRLMRRVGGGNNYQSKRSLYLASNAEEAARLREEYDVRRRYGFRLNYLDRDSIRKSFGFTRPAALESYDAGELDPYLMTHLLLDRCKTDYRAKTFDRTAVTALDSTRDGRVLLSTDRGYDIKARKVVFATGYETRQFLKRDVVSLKSSYAMVSEPVADLAKTREGGHIIWEAKRPYLYVRTTDDLRLMVGGEDEDFVNPTRRDKLIPAKTRTLLKKAQELFPDLRLEIGYSWAGTFGETEDSLPYIGEVEEVPNAYFALCYGANGSNFAVMGAEIIRDLYLGRENADAQLFKFDR